MTQYGIWRAVNATAALDFTPWVLAVAHLMFTRFAALFAGIAIADADPPPPHVLPRQSVAPQLVQLTGPGAARPSAR